MSFIVPTFDQLKHVKALDATFLKWFHKNATADELAEYNDYLREKDTFIVEPVEQPEQVEEDCDTDYEYESDESGDGDDDLDDEPWWWE